jgi:hypothetical protein
MSGDGDVRGGRGDDGGGGDLESLRRAFAGGPSQPPAPADCPAPETIWLAVHGELPADALRHVVDHLAACPACTEEWRLAVAFERPQALQGGDTAAAPEPERRRRRPLAAWVAASGMAAALLIGIQVLRAPAPAPAVRGGLARAAAPRPPLLTEIGCQALSRSSCSLSWTVSPDASYDVVVYTRSGRIVAHAEKLRVNFYQVPAAQFTGLTAGSVLSWQVTATVPGRPSATSQIETFSLH